MQKLLNNISLKQQLILIFCFYILFFVFRIFSGNLLLADSYEYIDVSNNIKLFLFSNEKVFFLTRRPILYPFFLSISSVFKSFYFTLFLQSIFSFLAFLIIFKMSLRDKKPLFVLFFVFFTPSIFIYSQLIMSEWLVFFLLTLLYVLLFQEYNTKNFAYIQLITILLAFTKPIFYPFIFINFILFSFFFIKNKKFSFWLFMPLICLLFYLNYNKSKTGYQHFSSIENTNLIDYNLYYFKASKQSTKEADNWIKQVYSNKEYVNQSFKNQNIYLKKVAVNEIKNNFLEYSFYHFYTSIRGVFDPGRFDIMTFFKKEDGKQGFLEILNGKKPMSFLLKDKFIYVYLFLIPVLITLLIKYFYFAKYVFNTKINFQLFYLYILALYYIFASGPVNSSRYMMPLQLIIFVLAYKGFLLNKTNNAR